MAIVTPTVTAFSMEEYNQQLRCITDFADRVHLDLMDGVFAPTTSPTLSDIWLPHNVRVDLHIMYQKPMEQLANIIRLKPRLVIIQAEADVHHMHFASELHKEDISVGLAILQHTPVANIQQIMHSFDHILVFSGKLGFHGGETDLSLLSKVMDIRTEYPEVEIGWDGGINDTNAKQLTDAGVDVLNVGGYIQKSHHPKAAYEKIKASLL